MDTCNDAIDLLAPDDLVEEVDGSGLPPLDEPDDPRRPRRNGRVDRRLPVWAVIGAMALIIAVERLSMVTMVTTSEPVVLTLAATVFFGGNSLFWWLGGRWLSRRMAEARPPRGPDGRILRQR